MKKKNVFLDIDSLVEDTSSTHVHIIIFVLQSRNWINYALQNLFSKKGNYQNPYTALFDFCQNWNDSILQIKKFDNKGIH